MREWDRHSGALLVGTGALHTLVGVAAFRRQLAGIRRDGYWNTMDTHQDRQSAFWFLYSGLGLIFTGQVASWARRETGRLPRSLGWSLLAASAAGVVLMPVSGFWLVIPQALLLLAARKDGDGHRTRQRHSGGEKQRGA